MTKSRKILNKVKMMAEKNEKCKLAFKAMKEGKFKSVRKCAEKFDISKTSLQRFINNDVSDLKGAGSFSSVFTPAEEKQI